MFETWYAMSAMLRQARTADVDHALSITDRFPASRWADAFAAARAADRGKVVIDWTQLRSRGCTERLRDELQATLAEIRDAGLFKDERELSSPQAATSQRERAARC